MSKESVHINYADNNTRSVLNVLISFNCIIDTDFGLLVLIARNFFDTSVFNANFFSENSNINNMKRSIYKRKESNPIKLCIKNQEDADDYYNQFFENYYKEILDVSMVTGLGRSLKVFSSNAGASFTILCKDKYQEEFLSRLELFKKMSTITLDKITNPDIYNQFFFKDYKDYGLNDLSDFLIDKKIYIGMYEFNKTDNLDLDSSTMQTKLFALRNEISLIDLYSREEINNEG